MMRRHLPVLLLLGLAGMLPAEAALPLTRAQKEETTKRFLRQLSDLNLWAGVVACSDKSGDDLYQDAYGTASYELMRAPMSTQLRMPTADNANLMLAVALHQLQAKGLLNISDPVSQHIDPVDFNLAGAWCPRVTGAPAASPCEQPTIAQVLTHTAGLWDSTACVTPLDWQKQACDAARVAGASPAAVNKTGSWVVANWVLGQPLASKPGERYSYSDDGYALLAHIVERASGQRLGDYLAANIFGPAALEGALYVPGARDGGAAGTAGLVENLVDNSGYVSLFNASMGAATALSVSLDLNGSVSANADPNSFDLSREAGQVFMTVVDLHDWYRRLFGNPETLGLTPASFAALTAPAVQLEGDNYEGQGLATNANASSWFYAGNDASWRSFPSIKVAEGATANDSPVCGLISNLSPRVRFADPTAQGMFAQQCGAVPTTEEALGLLAAKAPKLVAEMSAEERQAALLGHLCYMAYYESQGMTAEEYVRDAVAALIWDARSNDLEAFGLLQEPPEAAPEAPEAPEAPADKPAGDKKPQGQEGGKRDEGKKEEPEPPKPAAPSPKPKPEPKPEPKPQGKTGPAGTFTDWVLDCKGGRSRCYNIVLASMGYQCMNGAGTACCATEDAHNCKPADSVDANDISFEWEGEWPESYWSDKSGGSSDGNGGGNGGNGGNGGGNGGGEDWSGYPEDLQDYLDQLGSRRLR